MNADCYLRNLAENGRRQIAGNSSRLVEYFLGREEKNKKEENEYVRGKDKLEERELGRKNGEVWLSCIYMRTPYSLSIE